MSQKNFKQLEINQHNAFKLLVENIIETLPDESAAFLKEVELSSVINEVDNKLFEKIKKTIMSEIYLFAADGTFEEMLEKFEANKKKELRNTIYNKIGSALSSNVDYYSDICAVVSKIFQVYKNDFNFKIRGISNRKEFAEHLKKIHKKVTYNNYSYRTISDENIDIIHYMYYFISLLYTFYHF